MRIAVVDRDRCQPERCNHECVNFCPPQRTGEEVFELAEGKPVIDEELCVGCNICVRKCPFDAIRIVNLPEELEEPLHRYGRNGFALYGVPRPPAGRVVGILGPNGIGKTTSMEILSGNLTPNLGGGAGSIEEVVEKFGGTELGAHFKRLRDGEVTFSRKPQYVDALSDVSGTARDLLERVSGVDRDLLERLEIDHLLDRELSHLSGGELQRVAIAACLSREADFHFLDEVTPFLDIRQRVAVARLMKELSDELSPLVVDHDMAILDLLSDAVHVGFGEPGAYGVITPPKSTRRGINQYLEGFLTDENVRIRDEPVTFERDPGRTRGRVLHEFPELSKDYGEFSMEVREGELREGETVCVVGPNATGKSTFVKMLAGAVEPEGEAAPGLTTSYKPQYIEADFYGTVEQLLVRAGKDFGTSMYRSRIVRPLDLVGLMDRELSHLSGGELQRVAIAACLSREADIYLLDEPSAHLDVEQRLAASRAIKRHAASGGLPTLVVDHDMYMVDLLADRLMVFSGEPGRRGVGEGPMEKGEGMNRFLEGLGITFRRDEDSGRPRINKPGSRVDRERRSRGEYYY
ncbi:MAG: Trehalose/maltose import ATP-binding protein MalK [Methanonatronarchaeales archaeon]|nr:Trehalose/maltose import ATP-binding protein MalK [Methanonatronarchaeales archaeon]